MVNFGIGISLGTLLPALHFLNDYALDGVGTVVVFPGVNLFVKPLYALFWQGDAGSLSNHFNLLTYHAASSLFTIMRKRITP